jgi:DNA-binding LacI/PurR family transcriptional regulator
MEDVAREAGVSRALVSLVFRGRPNVSEQRRQAVLDAAELLGYRLNAAASTLARHRSQVLALVVNDLSNPWHASGVEVFQQRAEAAGHRLVLGAVNRDPRRERMVVETLLEHRPDGLLLVGSLLPRALLDDYGRQLPTVVIGRLVRGAGVDCVAVDDRRGAALVVEHLAALGHQRITHVDGGNGAGAAPRRWGYRRTMARLGLAEHVDVVASEYTEAAGFAAAEHLLGRDRLPTAVFAADDLVALGLLDGLRTAGVRVPEDVSVVGFDDTTLARLQSISLTTVSQPVEEMVAVAVDLVLQRLAGDEGPPVSSVFAPDLVVRRTTAPP